MDKFNETIEYKEGWDAFLNEYTEKDCPYPENSTQATDWRLGRLDAQLEYK